MPTLWNEDSSTVFVTAFDDITLKIAYVKIGVNSIKLKLSVVATADV